MCFDLDSRPPIAPIAGGALDSEHLTLACPDGNRFVAFRARATEPSGAPGRAPAVIVLPDVRGLHPYYEELALRFAEAGVDAIAIDYFGRTAGAERRGEDFDYMAHVPQTTWDGLQTDIRVAAAQLLGDAGAGRVASLFTVGFCFGGRVAFLSLTMGLPELRGGIGFYGWPTGPSRNDTPAPAELAGQMRGSLLGIFGGADQGISPQIVGEFERALTAAGVDHEVVTYPGAPHSFFDRKAGDYADASADAWGRVLEFVRTRSA
jgi:carboxymethylenebutenolidase